MQGVEASERAQQAWGRLRRGCKQPPCEPHLLVPQLAPQTHPVPAPTCVWPRYLRMELLVAWRTLVGKSYVSQESIW